MIDGVHIWRATLDGPGWSSADELPPAERTRASKFLGRDVARRWVASRWALRRVLCRYLDMPAAEIELELGGHGKPRLRNSNGLEFNLSHSEGLAVVAVAERPVGIDVEAIRPGRDTLTLVERILPAEEVETVRAATAPDRDAAFYAAWTCHEARLKCLATGLSAPTAKAPVTVVPVDVAPAFAAAVAAAGNEHFTPRCHSLEPGY
jgi:4'-phosphopantetheinyl transferase